jgi:hypothetical protein
MKLAHDKVIDGGIIWFEGSSVGSTLYPPGSTLGPRIQAYVQLVFIHFGSINFHIDGKGYKLKANQVRLLFPGHEEYHEFDFAEETLHSYVHIHPSSLPPEVQSRLSFLPRTIPLSKPMENLIHQAITSNSITLSTRDKLLSSMASQMLWLYIGEAEALGRKEAGDVHKRVPKAQLYIHDHLADELNLDIITS